MIEPVIVSARQGQGPVPVADHAVGQPLGRVENCHFDVVFVQEVEPVLRIGPFPFSHPTSRFSQRAEVAVESQPRPKGIAPVPLQILVRRSDEFAQLFVKLLYMPVRVYDPKLCHRVGNYLAPCLSKNSIISLSLLYFARASALVPSFACKVRSAPLST